MKILNKNGLPYSRRVLFAPSVVILPIALDLSDFFEFCGGFVAVGTF